MLIDRFKLNRRCDFFVLLTSHGIILISSSSYLALLRVRNLCQRCPCHRLCTEIRRRNHEPRVRQLGTGCQRDGSHVQAPEIRDPYRQERQKVKVYLRFEETMRKSPRNAQHMCSYHGRAQKALKGWEAISEYRTSLASCMRMVQYLELIYWGRLFLINSLFMSPDPGPLNLD